MIRKNLGLITALSAATDALLIFLSYFLAVALRFDLLDGVQSVAYGNADFVLMAALCAAGSVLSFYVLGFYRLRRPGRGRGETLTMLTVIGVFTLLYAAMLFVRRVSEFSRMLLLLSWLAGGVLVAGKHCLWRKGFEALRRRGFNIKHVAIVGNGHLAQQYAQDVRNHPEMGVSIDGYVSGVAREGLGKRLGRYEDLGEILDAHEFDELIVALEPHEVAFMPTTLAAADKAGIRLSLIPFYNDYIPSQPTVDVLGRTKLMDMRSTPLDHLGWALVKRAVDVFGSLALIVLTGPVMIAVAVGVKMSSPGPVLFRQERVGRGKKPFQMYKFRSMRVNDAQDTAWSTDSDPRKTRFGSFIRRYSLDELPQFFNVLKGDMSLIGPRPEIPFHVNHFKEEIPLYLLRHQVRPGITGWAQVHGLRGDTSIEKRVRFDLWYIQNWSLLLDARILLMTVFGGMKNSEQ